MTACQLSTSRPVLPDCSAEPVVKPYALYVNPFSLLGLDPFASDFSKSQIGRAKKRLLAEIELNEGRVPWVRDLVLDRSRALTILSELDDEVRYAEHLLVAGDQPLLSFLTHGNLAVFDPEKDRIEVLARDEHGNVCFPELFAQQYDSVLLALYSRRETDLIAEVSDSELPVPSRLHDDCYRSTHRTVSSLVEQTTRMSSQLDEIGEASQDFIATLKQQVDDTIEPALLNALPSYFRGIRSQLAMVLRSMAVVMYNNHDRLKVSANLLSLARSIETDASVQRRMDDDAGALREIQDEESRAQLRISIGRRTVEITKTHISFRKQTIPIDSIAGLRWGVFRQYTNGVKSSCSYLVSVLGSGGRCLNIECHHRKFLSLRDHEEESLHRFQSVLETLHQRVITQLVGRFVETMREGGTIRIGAASLSSSGITFSRGILFWRREIEIPWPQVRVNNQSGEVILRDLASQKDLLRMGMRDVWNAVLLDYITHIAAHYNDR